MKVMENNKENSLALYIDYDTLSVQQYCSILTSIENIALEITKILNADEILLRIEDERFVFLAPEFLVEEIHTGGSIFNQFKLGKGLLPKLDRNDEDEPVLVIPEWAAALSMAGTVLMGGLTGYKLLLEVEKLQLENEKIQIEIDALKKGKSEKKKEALNNIKVNLMVFHNEIEKANIKSVKINDVRIKDKHDKE
ncbi:MAG: hypothetical protein OIF51_19155 [Cellvibrionaceae bacterium]|nr:hypothetical protein [Cellvibrionaceae bacterium]